MERLSKAKLKLFASLHQKKYRYQHRMFLAEGQKMLSEALASDLAIEAVIVRETESIPSIPHPTFATDSATFERLSTQVNSEGIITVLHFPDSQQFQTLESLETIPPGPGLVLDDLRDPGNMGTLIRTADWFGFQTLICSRGTVDPFNPKVVRAAMGSLFRLRIIQVADLDTTLQHLQVDLWVADMEGQPLPEVNLQDRPFILIGNEANGVRDSARQLPQAQRITIPRLGQAESLNAGVAGSILAALWRLEK